MPSVPLMSARPSFSTKVDRRQAVRAQRVGRRQKFAVAGTDVPLTHDRERDVRQRREIP